jgi:hypothetical protein
MLSRAQARVEAGISYRRAAIATARMCGIAAMKKAIL